jgi:hypothetical protein
MKRILFVAMMVVASATSYISASAQNEPVLYFCERYGDDGEVGVSDRFTTGYITVMVKSSSALGLKDCYIQYDKYNTSSRKFEYYKQFSFEVEPDMKYIFFERTSGNDMAFDSPGFYRVFLLDSRKNTIASALVEIISK